MIFFFLDFMLHDFFFFLLGLQEIFFRNLPTPPQKSNGPPLMYVVNIICINVILAKIFLFKPLTFSEEGTNGLAFVALARLKIFSNWECMKSIFYGHYYSM